MKFHFANYKLNLEIEENVSIDLFEMKSYSNQYCGRFLFILKDDLLKLVKAVQCQNFFLEEIGSVLYPTGHEVGQVVLGLHEEHVVMRFFFRNLI